MGSNLEDLRCCYCLFRFIMKRRDKVSFLFVLLLSLLFCSLSLSLKKKKKKNSNLKSFKKVHH